jgi:hypothetical protein
LAKLRDPLACVAREPEAERVALAGGVAGDRPASGRRHTAEVRPDHADVRRVVTRRTGSEMALPVNKRRRFHVVGSIPMLHTEAQTVHEMLEDQPNETRAVPHATYSRFGRCVRRQRQWTLGRCRRHRCRLVKSGR